MTFTWLVPEDNLQKAKSLLFRENDEKLINDTFQKNLKIRKKFRLKGIYLRISLLFFLSICVIINIVLCLVIKLY